jgi:hypothetical protein
MIGIPFRVIRSGLGLMANGHWFSNCIYYGKAGNFSMTLGRKYPYNSGLQEDML